MVCWREWLENNINCCCNDKTLECNSEHLPWWLPSVWVKGPMGSGWSIDLHMKIRLKCDQLPPSIVKKKEKNIAGKEMLFQFHFYVWLTGHLWPWIASLLPSFSLLFAWTHTCHTWNCQKYKIFFFLHMLHRLQDAIIILRQLMLNLLLGIHRNLLDKNPSYVKIVPLFKEHWFRMRGYSLRYFRMGLLYYTV